MQESEQRQLLNEDERQQVRETLEAVLTSEKFDAAPQMSAFLRYVVEQAANGNQSRIKAFTVAVDALGKPETFDPQNDPVVRVLAGRLRAALAAYNDDHQDAELVITMKPGSYVPMFLHRDVNELEEPICGLPVTDDSVPANQVEPEVNATVNFHPASVSDVPQTAKSANTTSDYVEIATTSADFERESLPSPPDNQYFDEQTDDAHVEKNNLLQRVLRIPLIAVAGVLALAVVLVVLNNQQQNDSTPMVQAASPDNNLASMVLDRPRPDEPTVFISAIDNGNSLENSLNAVVSSVISEEQKLNVYRILAADQNSRFWPEDYILNLSVLDLPDETRVNMQLMEALSGRIVHSQATSLSSVAVEQLTHEELKTLLEAARAIVSEDGPLIADHLSREIQK